MLLGFACLFSETVFGADAFVFCKAAADKFNHGDYAEAIKQCDRAIELYPAYDAAYKIRGAAKDQLKDYAGAMKDLEMAIQINPKSEESYYDRAVCHFHLTQYESAMADLTRASELKPGQYLPYSLRGQINAQLNNMPEAVADYTKVIELNPQGAESYMLRGRIYDGLNETDKALADYSKAIELNPQESGLYTLRGRIFDQLHKPAEAVADYAKAIELHPHGPAAAEDYKLRGAKYFNQDQNYKAAFADFDRAAQENPGDGNALFLRAMANMQLADYPAALKDLQRADELNPNDAATKNYLAIVKHKAETNKWNGLIYVSDPTRILSMTDGKGAKTALPAAGGGASSNPPPAAPVPDSQPAPSPAQTPTSETGVMATNSWLGLPDDVQNLLLGDKYAEALIRVDALLKDDPDNPWLKRARPDIARQANLPAGGDATIANPNARPADNSQPAPAAPAKAEAEPGPTGEPAEPPPASADMIKAAPAEAVETKTLVEIESKNQEAVFEKSDASQNWWVATKRQIEVVYHERVTGTDKVPTDTSKDVTVDTFPGSTDSYTGVLKAKVEKVGDTIYLLIIEKSESTQPNGTVVKTSRDQRLEMALVAGTWDDFESGKTVRLRLSPQGKIDYLNYYKAQTEKAAQILRDNPAFDGAEVTATVTPIGDNIDVMASTDRIEIKDMVLKQTMNMVGTKAAEVEPDIQ